MQIDSCPHRSASLSLGDVVEDCITCPFHGFRFDPTGGCSLVPETGRAALNLNDYAHLLFVHRRTIGRGLDVSGTRRIDCNDRRISMYVDVENWGGHIFKVFEKPQFLNIFDNAKFYVPANAAR